jgi:hypothetical protein
MLNIIEATLNEVKLGDPQHYRNMSVFPLLFSGKSKLEYLMLGKALNEGIIMITEISENGSVPELKLINMSETYILLLDGEELEGAKQNRVLNTTILVYPKSELKVPVSCTEQGRWNRVSAAFHDSEKIMFSRARGNKMSSVHQSLKYGGGYQSNQSEVWKDISQLQNKLNIHSPTSAMKDIYDKEKDNLDDFLKAFEQVDLIASPTSPTPAFRLGEKSGDPLQMYLSDIYTISCNLAGICGLSLPCGFSEKGLPIGLQLLGQPFGEAQLLQAAHAYEQVTDWHLKKPDLN